MKKHLLTTLALFCAFTTFAQNTTYKYYFDNTLKEFGAQGPALTGIPGTLYNYPTESLPIGINKMVYHFPKSGGLVFDDAAGFLSSGSYTIELYFKLDTTQGYKKLVDMDSLGADKGLYNQSGNIVMYSSFTSADTFISAGKYAYVAVSRNASTKEMYFNGNGKSAGTYKDNTDQYIENAKKKLIFFRDDNSTSGEHSGGSVAMIRISNYAIDSNTIKSNYTGIAATLGIAGSQGYRSLGEVLYPNPATDNIHLNAIAVCNYSICDITGKVLASGTLQQGDNNIAVTQLSNGLYFLKIVSADVAEQRVYKFTKQ